MKKIIAVALMSAMPFAAAYAQQAPDKAHPAEKAMDSATPEMKNPGGTDKLHPAQKAMDEATPAGSGASSGASSGEGAAPGSGGTTYNAQDANSAAGKNDNKQKIPADNKIPHSGDQKQQQ